MFFVRIELFMVHQFDQGRPWQMMSSYVPMGTDPDALRTSSSSSSPEAISVSTVAATAVGTGHHMLKVSDYSWLKATHGGKNGNSIESSFNVGGHTWRLRLCLNGEKEENAGFVSLFLGLSDDAAAAAGSTTVVHADFELALVHHQGTSLLWRRAPPSYGVSTIRLFHPKATWGYPRYISVEDLERSVFLRDG